MLPSVTPEVVLPCERPVTFEYRNELFYITDPALGFVRTMRPGSFMETVVNAVEAARQYRPWDKPTAEIINLADHAAASRGNQSSN